MDSLKLGEIAVPVLYIDDDLLAVNKPAGLPVFTARDRLPGTLSEVVLANGISLYDGEGTELPGVVHRLDKDTSGVMVLARSEAGWNGFRQQIAARQTQEGVPGSGWGRFRRKAGKD